MNRGLAASRDPWDREASRAIPAVRDHRGQGDRQGPWGREDCRASEGTLAPKVIPGRSGFEGSREIRGQSDRGAIKVRSVHRAILAPWDLLDRKATGEKKETVVPPVNRAPPDCRVHRVNLAHRESRAIKAAQVLKVNKASPARKDPQEQKVTLDRRVQKEIKEILAPEEKKVTRVILDNRAFKDRKAIRAIPDFKGKRETLANRVSKDRKAILVTLDLRVRKAIRATLESKASRGRKAIPGTLGPQGEKGDKGDTDEQGIQGPQGEKGDTGETPVITVVEDTPLSYKLNFKTSVDDITTPNLFKALDEYHVNLSAADSTLNIPLKNLILTYQRTAATTARITIAAKNTAVPVLTDMRRVTIYNSTSVESQTYNNTRVSTRTVLDEIVYSDSQESHSMKIRQQDPETGLWSLCEIHTFISAGGARTSVWIQWSEIDVSYEAPTA